MPYYTSGGNGGGGGGSAFGSIPAPLPKPKSIYEELGDAVPNYAGLTQKASGVIQDQINGQVSPETMNLIQNRAAAGGVASGVPGSRFQNNNMLANLGLTSEQLQQQGLTNYNQFSNTLGNEQLSPELQNEINTQNVIDAAAPNPAAAQSYAQMLFDKYLNPKSASGGPPEGYSYQPAGSNTWIAGQPPT